MASGVAAQIFPDQTQLVPGARLTYNVLNTGTIPIAFGRPHRLERLEDDGWNRVPTEPGGRTALYTLHPAHARQLKLKLPRSMAPGRYRLTLEVKDYSRRSEPLLFRGLRPQAPVEKTDVSFEFAVAD